MGKPIALEVVAGEVSRVRFFTETLVPRKRGRVPSSDIARTINAVGFFLREAQSQRERDFTVRNTTVGMADGHRVTLICSAVRGQREALTLAVVNQTTGQWEERPRAVDAAARPKPLFGPIWRTFGLSVAAGALWAGVSHFVLAGGYQGWGSVMIGALVGLSASPIFWLTIDVLGRFETRACRAQTRALVKAEIAHQVAIGKAVTPGR